MHLLKSCPAKFHQRLPLQEVKRNILSSIKRKQTYFPVPTQLNGLPGKLSLSQTDGGGSWKSRAGLPFSWPGTRRRAGSEDSASRAAQAPRSWRPLGRVSSAGRCSPSRPASAAPRSPHPESRAASGIRGCSTARGRVVAPEGRAGDCGTRGLWGPPPRQPLTPLLRELRRPKSKTKEVKTRVSSEPGPLSVLCWTRQPSHASF